MVHTMGCFFDDFYQNSHQIHTIILEEKNNICYHGGTMKKPKFEFYTRLNGHTEFLEFLQTIPIKDK